MPSSLITRVRRFIAQHQLFERGARIVVALSGGSDSVALACILRELDAAHELQAVGLVHFNHQLRPTADRDEAFAVALARSCGSPIVVERADVREMARQSRESVEVAARRARYECFERACEALGASVVALGHTRDDQAETFLLRMLRGAGPTGLAGIHPKRGIYVRPVLCCRRRELQELLAERGLDYVEDETNADVSIPRNRVRAELLPLLESRFNPAVVDLLASEAELAREQWRWLEESAVGGKWDGSPAGVASPDEVGAEAVASPGSSPRRELDVDALKAAPAVLRRFVVWRAMTEASGGRSVSFAHVESALALLDSTGGRPLDMPGHRVQRLGSKLVLSVRVASDRQPQRDGPLNLFEYPLSIPGSVPVPQLNVVLSAERLGAGTVDGAILRSRSRVAVVRDEHRGGTWRVRNRRPGDRFRPIGLGGRKKLQDFFVDRKVPRERRDTVPLVVDERDRIVWVAGYGIDEAFRVTDPTQAVIMLELKLLGGSA
jgi:tRNA(Ile)-lysidine synthase